jgi:hypothetical protein
MKVPVFKSMLLRTFVFAFVGECVESPATSVFSLDLTVHFRSLNVLMAEFTPPAAGVAANLLVTAR